MNIESERLTLTPTERRNKMILTRYEKSEIVNLKRFLICYSNPDIDENDYANEMQVWGKDKKDAEETFYWDMSDDYQIDSVDEINW